MDIKKNGKVKIIIVLMFLMFLLGGFFIYWGVYTYYDLQRKDNFAEGINAIYKGDLNRASFKLTQSYEDGDLYALAYLAWLEISRGGYQKALTYARDATHYQLQSAFEVMGDLALLGYGDAKGVNAAMYYFEQSIKGLSKEQKKAEMAAIIDRSLRLCKDSNDHLSLAKKGISYDSKNSYLAIGDALFVGDILACNPRAAIKEWQKAYALGSVEAATRLASAYWYGYGIERDFQKALNFYKEAADKGDPYAIHSLALIKIRKAYTSSEFDEAISLFKKAASLSFGPSEAVLGFLRYKDGLDLDIFASYQWFKRAAKHSSVSGTIMYALLLESRLVDDPSEKYKDKGLEILYDLKLSGHNVADDILKLLAHSANIETIVRSSYQVSRDIILGNVHFQEGDPLAQLYHDKVEHAEAYYKAIDEETRTRLMGIYGRNFTPISAIDDYRIKDRPLLNSSLAKFINIENPTSGARPFIQSIVPPRPKLPLLPEDLKDYEGLDVANIKEDNLSQMIYDANLQFN